MMTRDRLLAAAHALPDGASITLPVADLRAALEGSSDVDLTVPEVAARFNRAASTIRSWLERGVLKGYRLRGREWRVPPAAIAEFEAAERDGRTPSRSRAAVTNLAAWRDEPAA